MDRLSVGTSQPSYWPTPQPLANNGCLTFGLLTILYDYQRFFLFRGETFERHPTSKTALLKYKRLKLSIRGNPEATTQSPSTSLTHKWYIYNKKTTFIFPRNSSIFSFLLSHVPTIILSFASLEVRKDERSSSVLVEASSLGRKGKGESSPGIRPGKITGNWAGGGSPLNDQNAFNMAKAWDLSL